MSWGTSRTTATPRPPEDVGLVEEMLAEMETVSYPEETVGFVIDPEFGTSLIPDYARIVAVFDDPTQAKARDGYR